MFEEFSALEISSLNFFIFPLSTQILSENNASPAGGIVLLITDGKDGNVAKTEEMKEIYIQKNIIIDVVAFGDEFDENLAELSIKTCTHASSLYLR